MSVQAFGDTGRGRTNSPHRPARVRAGNCTADTLRARQRARKRQTFGVDERAGGDIRATWQAAGMH